MTIPNFWGERRKAEEIDKSKTEETADGGNVEIADQAKKVKKITEKSIDRFEDLMC
jgi:hypothetical protein